MPQIKLMTTKEAVARFVPDGATICGGNFLHPVPHALYHEVIRQRKRGLTLWCQSSIEEAEQLIVAGCLSRLVTSFSYRPGGSAATSHLEKAFLAGEVDLVEQGLVALLPPLGLVEHDLRGFLRSAVHDGDVLGHGHAEHLFDLPLDRLVTILPRQPRFVRHGVDSPPKSRDQLYHDASFRENEKNHSPTTIPDIKPNYQLKNFSNW